MVRQTRLFYYWSWSVEKIRRFVDSVGYPYDNAKSFLNGKVVKFIDIEVVSDVFVEHRWRHIGKVIFIKYGMPIVVCKDGLIGLKDIRDEKDSKIFINFRSRFE